jgi:hypothetical protein
MGKKPINLFKFIMLIICFLASFNIQAVTDNNVKPSNSPDLIKTQQRTIVNTKNVKLKAEKKSKNQSSSLGAFRLLIPDSLK